MKVMHIVFSLTLLTACVGSTNADVVVAKFNGGSISVGDLKKVQASGPDQIKSLPFDKVFTPLRDQKVMEKVLENAKAAANLANDPEVKKMKEEAAKRIEMEVFLKREAEKRSTDEKLNPLYSELVKQFKDKKEFEVSIIVCNDKAQADKALQELNSGKTFDETAKKYSTEPNTKAQGGRLGFLLAAAVDQVLGPDIGKALKILKEGAHSRSVISKGGKFIIVQRGSSRQAKAPTFEEVKPQLKAMYLQKALLEYFQDLIKKADVKVYTADGKPDQFQLMTPPAKKS